MVLMFLIGIILVIASFLCIDAMFGRREAILTTLLVAISPVLITHARFIWPPFPIPLLTVCYFFCVYRILQKKEKYFPVLLFILGAMTHFETATAATFLIPTIVFTLFILAKRLISWRMLLLGCLAIVITQTSLIVFDLKHQFLNTKGIINMLTTPAALHTPFDQVLHARWSEFRDNLLTTFPLGQVVWPLLGGFVFIGSAFYLWDKKNTFAQKTFLIYLLSIPIILFLVFLHYSSYMWGWWILELPIVYCLLIGILSGYVWKNFIARVGVVIVCIILFASYCSQTYTFYKNDLNDFGGFHKIKGKEQALDYIYQDAAGKPFQVMIFTPRFYTPEYDYLFSWYGRTRYGFVPNKKVAGTVYLLIEPDPVSPWTYKGWLETVIKKGSVLKTKTLMPSGLIVQKRHVQ